MPENNIEFFSIYDIGFYKTYIKNLQVEDLIKKVYKYKETWPTNASRSNMGGYQSTIDINTHPDFFSLTQNLNNLFFKAFQNPLQIIKGMWINISPHGCYNDIHTHGFDPRLISGVIYLQVPENSGEIEFRNPLMLSEPVTHFPVAKEVLLFSQNIPHQVKPNLSQEDRISIAFNYG